MSQAITSFFSPKGGQPVTPLKRKRDIDDDGDQKQSKDKRYDLTKRTRRFQPHWKLQWTWLDYLETEDKMYCTVCKQFPSISEPRATGIKNQFVQGTDNFRTGTIKAHDESTAHKECIIHFRHKEGTKHEGKNLVDTEIGAAFLKLTEAQQDKMEKMFTIAYSLARYSKPLSDMEFQCRVAKLLKVDLSHNYGRTRVH
jgi:hypothetical protein